MKTLCTLLLFPLIYINCYSQNPCPEIPIVKYDGKTYHTVQIGNQCWLKENLDVGVIINGSLEQTKNGLIEKYCYKNDSANCTKYGGLYQWYEAMQYSKAPGAQGICPEGWHIPTNNEFTTLAALVHKDGMNINAFSGLLSGYYLSNGSFYALGGYTYFWSSTPKDDTNDSCIYLNSNNGNISQSAATEECGFSVRCIKSEKLGLLNTLGINENKIMKKGIIAENETKPKKSSAKTFCPGIPTVKYEGKIYHTVQIGNQCWLKENLDRGVMINGSLEQTNNGLIEKYCYRNDSVNCSKYGGLYQWDEAMQYSQTSGAQGICPEGWHIPTNNEFTTLAATVNKDGNALKSAVKRIDSETGTNTSDFSALMSGCRRYNGEFDDFDDYTYFWSSTGKDTTDALDMYLGDYEGNIYQYYNDKLLGFSIRCIKD